MARRPPGWKVVKHENPIPHDLADSDDEDLVNLDIDDGVNVVYSNVARSHGGDGGGDDRPPPYQVPTGCGGCLGNRCKGTRKPNLGGRLHTRQETKNLEFKAIKDKSGLVPIREFPLHYHSWRQMPPERKAGVVAKTGTQFDLRPHIESDRCPKYIRATSSTFKRSTMDAQLAFWNDPNNLAWAAQNKQNQAKGKVVCRQGSRSIAAL
nr:hypothetical protein [Tanacetum cinerariifolium]